MNNRQNGRRRGRGGQQTRSGQPGGPDRGNRLDNRARGNAAQLLEKYKTLARDAQMQGDRVNTEYYLQFADHYFRVLSESRSRFEEQQQRRPQGESYRDDFGGDEDGNEPQRADQNRDDNQGDDGWDGEEADQRPEPPRREFQPRREREPRAQQADGSGNNGDGEERGEYRRRNANGNGNGANGNGRAAPAQGNGFTAPDFLNAEAPRIEMERVPPSIAADAEPVEAEEGEAAPRRRRPRRPKTEAAPVEA